MKEKIIQNDKIYIINSNYDYINDNDLEKDNVNSGDFLKNLNLENDSIIVLQDNNLGGYMTFLETIKDYNKKNGMNLKPVISLKTKDNEGNEIIYYAKNKTDLQNLLSINNPYLPEVNPQNLGLDTELTETNYLNYKIDNIYQDLLDIPTGYFSPKYSGRFEPLLNPNNNFSAVKEYLINKVQDKLGINVNEHPEYLTRIKEEISVLSGGNHMKQNFLEYMFVVSDMVSIAKDNNIRVGPGRGSGAGSLTAYLLDITEVDPIENELSFERFLNKDRPSFPDFDIDFDSSKLNILKRLIQKDLGYSIIQIGTLNSHSHNDFLPNIKNLSFLTEEEKTKIIYDIKNDFDNPDKKEQILKDGEKYIYDKMIKFGIDINKNFIEINNDINKKLNNLPFFYEGKENINALKKISAEEYKKVIKELYNDKYKLILQQIGFDNLDYDKNKTALMRAVDMKNFLLKLHKEKKIPIENLLNFENDFQIKLFGGKINGRFFDFLVNENSLENKLNDYDFDSITSLSFNSSQKDLGDFLKYANYITENIEKTEFSVIHNNITNGLNKNNLEFYNSIYNYIQASLKNKGLEEKNIPQLLKYIEDFKITSLRNLSKSYDIINEVCNDSGLVNSFIKNFETYKGLGAHASGHIIVNKEQFNEMLKVFPVLKQKEEKCKKERDPVMGVSHKYVEKFGGVKFDLLGLKTLTIYDIAKNLSNETIKPEHLNRGNPICEKIIDFFSQDRDFSFIFQAEGVEIKTALNIMGKQLKANPEMKLIDSISNIIALARPGPIENGTLYDYLSEGKKTIENFDDKNIKGNEILNIRDKISKCLEGTNGYLIYQEQVIEIAKVMGLTGGEADNFRRAISKKNADLLSEQQTIFVEKGLNLCGENSKSEGNKVYLESVFKNLSSFAEYGFNKSHSVCYANLCCEGAYYAVEHPKEFVTSLFNTYGGEVGTLDGQSDYKEVLKSNDKIEGLMSFAGSLNVPILSYWDNEKINLIDVNKETDKENKILTYSNENGVILSSKILNSKNMEKLDYKKCWGIGKAIGTGSVIDISNLRYSNQKNYILKNENGEDIYKVKSLATFLKFGNNGRMEFTASIDNDKKYIMFNDKNSKINMKGLKAGDSVILDVNLINNKQTDKIFSNVTNLLKVESSYYHKMYEKAIELSEPKTTKDIEHTKMSNSFKSKVSQFLDQIS